MNPALWGPGLWHLMFSVTWNCRDEDLSTLLQILLHDIPLLVPCEKCQSHYVRNHATLVRRLGEPKSLREALEWVYNLKDEVNKTTKSRSIPLKDLRERLSFSGGRMDDVLVADTLVLVAIYSETHGTDSAFVDFCRNLTPLLPLPGDSELLHSLSRVRKPIVSHAQRAYKNTRIEHGVPYHSNSHLRSLVG